MLPNKEVTTFQIKKYQLNIQKSRGKNEDGADCW
jgi:hypothetical protein